MEPLNFLLLVLAYAIYLIIASIYTAKRLQNHKVHSIVFPDEELNTLVSKAKNHGKKFYQSSVILGGLILFVVLVNIIKYYIITNYTIITPVYCMAIICLLAHLGNTGGADIDGFWVGSAINLKTVIYYYEVQDFKKRSQWQEIIGERTMKFINNGIDDFIVRYQDCFYVRLVYLLTLACFFVSLLVNLFY